jgi:ATP-dependent helicase HrpA
MAMIESFLSITAQLSRFNPTDALRQDINGQLACLIYRGFIRNTPYSNFKAIPRYLRAIEYRIDKLNRDPKKIQEINRYSLRFWKDMEKKAQKNSIIPELDPFRWALEEFRVSLFAQAIKTAYPISAQRMDKAWDQRG